MLRDAYLEEKNECFFKVSNLEKLSTENLISFRASGGFGNIEGFTVRDGFTDYFSSRTGSLPWQMNRVSRTDLDE